MNVVRQEVIVGSTRGVHGRVATRLAEIAASHRVALLIHRDDGIVDCSSILDVLALALTKGTVICMTAEGDLAEKAMSAVVQVLTAEDES